MAINFLMSHRLSEPSTPHNIGLRGVPVGTTTESIKVEVSWRWRDTPDMEPQLFGFVTATKEFSIPFDLQGRDIILFFRSISSAGVPDVRRVQDGKQVIYGPSRVAEITALGISTATVTGSIGNNGGTGTIRVLRQLGTDPFVEVTTTLSTAVTFTDTVPVNGTYNYKLTQDGQTGESATHSVVASGAGSTTGTTPDGLTGDWDTVDTNSMSWTNHGGTGSIKVERKIGTGSYIEIASLLSSATSYNDGPIFQDNYNHAYYYRVRNTSATGYSNEIVTIVPGI